MRSAVKLISLVMLATVLIGAAIILIYKPIYKVTLNGEKIGYCQDKEALQNKINDYMENGEDGQKNVAFVQIDDMPEYKMCLQKKGITTNDEEIFLAIKETGITYYEKKVVTTTVTKYAATGSKNFSTSRALNYNKVNLGISLTRPVSGVLTSRYGYRWGRTHTGIDIGAPTGTAVKCAAAGKVT